MRRFVFTVFIIFLFFSSILAQALKTEALSDDIYTIQVNVNADWQRLPIIDMNSDDYIHICFDRLGDNSFNMLRYRVVYCNADWTPSSISSIEYVSGFNNTLIEDYAHSMSTTIDYTNFAIDIPNDRLQLKLSGNYAVEIYDESRPSETLLRACFSLLQAQVSINGGVSSNTMVDSNREHQQVSFTINYENLLVRDPFSDLKVFVRQNNRLDSQRLFVRPTSVQTNRSIYDFHRNLTFEAGNEYRRFETVSHRFNGLNVERVKFRNPYYYADIIADKIRANRIYSFDRDQNGRFLVRNAEVNDSNIGADYFMTNFRLECSQPFIENIYINGDFTNNDFDDKYLMKYDPIEGVYKLSLLLKQGAYNYQYLARSDDNFTPALTEGNYFETENEYCVLVYYRPFGSRYDELVGVSVLNSK